jgi:hypothetical protein
MSHKSPVNRIYLSVDPELEIRLEVAFAEAKKGRPKYARNDFLQSLVRFALDHQEDIKGSKIALAFRVGDRIAEKLDNLMIVLLAIFHIIAARSNAADKLKSEAFLWAVQSYTSMAERIAELRHSVPPKPDETDPE